MRKLVGVKCIVLALKYGRRQHREQALLTVMTTDIGSLISTKFGAVLLRALWKYCDRLKGIAVLNQFVKSNFSTHCKRISSYPTLSHFLNKISTQDRDELLLAHSAQFKLEKGSLREMITEFSKSKSQFDYTLSHFALVMSFE